MERAAGLIAADWETTVTQVLPEVIRLRRELHAWPELGFHEKKTSDAVATALKSSGVEVTVGVAETGVVGLIDNDSSRTIAFRADMDALPITETADVPYRSRNQGVAHSCGHDGHTAVLLGVARVLSMIRNQLQANVKFVFQPAEEGGGGGERMVREGVLTEPAVDAIFAFHSWPDLFAGQVGYRYGVMFANTDSFTITIRGKGGHAAHPHKAIDPIVMAAKVVDGFQTIVSREAGPLNPVVLTVAHIQGGTTHNVIPDTVLMEGTLRTLDRGVREKVITSMKRFVDSVGEMYAAPQQTLEIIKGYPSLTNDNAAVEYGIAKAKEGIGGEYVLQLDEPSMGGEDFAYYLEKVPGAMFRLGVASKNKAPAFLHTGAFDFNDGAIKPGMTTLVKMALDFGRDWRPQPAKRQT